MNQLPTIPSLAHGSRNAFKKKKKKDISDVFVLISKEGQAKTPYCRRRQLPRLDLAGGLAGWLGSPGGGVQRGRQESDSLIQPVRCRQRGPTSTSNKLHNWRYSSLLPQPPTLYNLSFRSLPQTKQHSHHHNLPPPNLFHSPIRILAVKDLQSFCYLFSCVFLSYPPHLFFASDNQTLHANPACRDGDIH